MGHSRLDLYKKDKKTQFKGNNSLRLSSRIKYSYIHSCFSKYKMFSLCFVYFSSQYMPHFLQGSFLYTVLFLFNHSLPLVDGISNFLDACPIRTFLEPLYVAVRLDIIVQAPLLYKCGQLVRYRAFDIVVAAFFSDIS